MFNELGLSTKVLSAVEAAGYTRPTPIQAAAIPHALEKRDVLGLAQTGTGKTASFVLPMLSLLERGRARARMPRTLILEPTRELAAQVAESFDKYGVNHKLTVALLIGGVSFDEQSRKVDRGADVVIATPGRLLDHLERGKLLLQQIEILVIDEADRMLDMGFIPDIERICKLLPITRQTLFFSATMPKEIQSLVDRFLHNPVRVEVSPPSSTAETVEQRFVRSGETPKDKRATLRRLLKAEDELTNGIIFCNRKRDIGTLFRSLERHGFSVGALHGDMDQRSRMATLDGFKNNKITLLVASDVAARGLDIPKVSHVFNYDVPHNAEDYVHRIGRTGRAGRSGKAFTISTPMDKKLVAAIESMIKRSVTWLEEGEAAEAAPAESRPRRNERRDSRRDHAARESAAPAEAKAAAPAPAKPVENAKPAESAKPAERPAERARPQPEASTRPHESKGGGEGRRNRGRRGEPDEPRVAFKDTPYVPAFLRRPIEPRRPLKSSAAAD
ncbi:DEAD/DEAH box helicase [Acuticoccus kandeliae]|uniref:DEAD/DEAH box helicase n=1 Tax=Acuticoccus kandeliae TaxID=2073160 RepID=UPI000D3EB8E1|nr:DEAD/DEAH box helicase [Acuticoccus kandeliae]